MASWIKRFNVLVHFQTIYKNSLSPLMSRGFSTRNRYELKNQQTQYLYDSLKSAIGESKVSDSLSVRDHHGKDESSFIDYLPEIVIFPSSVDEVSQCAKICYDKDAPIIPFGTGTGMEGGICAVNGGVCFDLSKMKKILNVNVEDFDAEVESGVTRLELNDNIRDTGLWFPVDPGADASLCGMASTSASGTNAVRYGTMKENVMNLEVVLADGTIFHTAGEGTHTRKSSAGYNMTSIFVGSEGTLGLITKATLKLHGVPEMTSTAVCQFPDIKSAVDSSLMILQSGVPIARIELLDEVQVMACNLYSYLDYALLPTLFFEFHGSQISINEQVDVVSQISLMNDGSDFKWATSEEEKRHLWKARHNAFYAAKSLKPDSYVVTTDVCVPISKMPEIISSVKQDIKDSGLIGPIVGHVGDGNFHCLLLTDPKDDNSKVQAKKLSHKIARRALSVGGTCSGEHGIGLGKKILLQEEIGPIGVAMSKKIKSAFDPKGIMNPGKVIL